MLKIIICLIIVILIYKIILALIDNVCIDPNQHVYVKQIFGTKIKGFGLSKKLGFPTINIIMNRELPCGYYEVNSNHGYAILLVGKKDKNKGFINFSDFKPEIDSTERFELWDVKRIVNNESELVTVYNNGCCSQY